jgi:prepilin-type N-terminal cleavage/methylation domain-containing protein
MMRFFGPAQTKDDGFSLIEILVAVSIGGLLLALSVNPLRTYFQLQTLNGARDQLVTELRRQQQRVVSESNPLVFGIRFRKGTKDWGIVRYHPTPPVGQPTCTEIGTRSLDGGVTFTTGTDFAVDTGATVSCRAALNAPTDDFVFFYARGTATQGSVVINHSSLGRSRTITVSPMTGRVTG